MATPVASARQLVTASSVCNAAPCLAGEIRGCVGPAPSAMPMSESTGQSLKLGEQVERDIVWRLYDLIEFGTGEYARRYLELVERVYAQDSTKFDYAATKDVIWNLHKAMVIKDEVYVSYPEGKPPQVQKRYAIYTPTKDVIHPDSKAKLGCVIDPMRVEPVVPLNCTVWYSPMDVEGRSRSTR